MEFLVDIQENFSIGTELQYIQNYTEDDVWGGRAVPVSDSIPDIPAIYGDDTFDLVNCDKSSRPLRETLGEIPLKYANLLSTLSTDQGVALSTCQHDANGLLSFKKGDIVTATARAECRVAWWTGSMDDGRISQFQGQLFICSAGATCVLSLRSFHIVLLDGLFEDSFPSRESSPTESALHESQTQSYRSRSPSSGPLQVLEEY